MISILQPNHLAIVVSQLDEVAAADVRADERAARPRKKGIR